MGIPIVQGRSFQPADAASSGMVAVVNERLVKTFWKDLNPVGQRLRPCCGDQVPWFTVIGVAKDVKQGGIDQDTGTEFYFFVSLGGFDTHQGQVTTQRDLLTQVAQAMKAFYDATIEINAAADVTTFTLSDFGRTFQPAGSAGTVGSDHAWGNHHLVMGGSVRGGDFYGVRGSNGTVFPTLQLSGPDDTDTRGRWIPTASVDQYAATLASWFGVSSPDLNTIFPQLKNFSPSSLGFLP